MVKTLIWFHAIVQTPAILDLCTVNCDPKRPIAITVTSWWTRWRIKSPALRLFTQSFIQAQIKENIKAPHHWPLWAEFTAYRVNSLHKWSVTRKLFQFDDVIMAILWETIGGHYDAWGQYSIPASNFGNVLPQILCDISRYTLGRVAF